jgi:rhodanese-related sulfurtransferase
MPTEMTPRELADRLQGPGAPVVLDVREPEEVAIASLAGAVLIPMGDIPARSGELPGDAEIVVVCHHGVRSAHVAGFPRLAGVHQGGEPARRHRRLVARRRPERSALLIFAAWLPSRLRRRPRCPGFDSRPPTG